MKSKKILKNHLHNHTKMERQVVAKYEKSKYDQNTADFLSYHHHIRFWEHIVKWLQILKKKKYYYSVSPSKDKKLTSYYNSSSKNCTLFYFLKFHSHSPQPQ